MVLSWIKLATSSLNAGVAATVAGGCTYFFCGGENKDEKEQIDEVLSKLKKEEEEFLVEKEKLEKERSDSFAKAQAQLLAAKEVKACLEKSEKTYQEEMKSFSLWDSIIGRTVTFKSEGCKK